MLDYYKNILEELISQKQEIIKEKTKENLNLIEKCNLNYLYM